MRTIMSFSKRHDDRYENALDDVIAQCDGDTRGALKALLAANEYLEAELQHLQAAIRLNGVPQLAEKVPTHLLN